MLKVVREPQMRQKIRFLAPLIGLLHHNARIGSRHPFFKEDLVQIGRLDDLV